MKLKDFWGNNDNDDDDDDDDNDDNDNNDDDNDSGLILPCLTLEHHAKTRVLAALSKGADLKIVQMKKII